MLHCCIIFLLFEFVLKLNGLIHIGKSISTPRIQTTQLNLVNELSSVEEFDQSIKSLGNGLLVIDYSTTWCGPCKLILPKFEALSEKYPDVKFFKCIGDATPSASILMKREGIRSVPAFHFWKNGEKIDSVSGARIDDVEQAIISNNVK